MQQLALIDLPTGELLARFGAGAATPGSGSAAALMALLSANLVCAVAKMTVKKSDKDETKSKANLMIDLLEKRVSSNLTVLFENDSIIFQQVIDARIRRDAPDQAENKRKNAKEASDKLKDATNILFEIAELSFQILENGLSIWDIGFQPAMGDAGAGISAAVAAITTCLLVANVNIRSSRSLWAREAKVKSDEIQARLTSAQSRVLQLVRQSTEKTAESLARPLLV